MAASKNLQEKDGHFDIRELPICLWIIFLRKFFQILSTCDIN